MPGQFDLGAQSHSSPGRVIPGQRFNCRKRPRELGSFLRALLPILEELIQILITAALRRRDKRRIGK